MIAFCPSKQQHLAAGLTKAGKSTNYSNEVLKLCRWQLMWSNCDRQRATQHNNGVSSVDTVATRAESRWKIIEKATRSVNDHSSG